MDYQCLSRYRSELMGAAMLWVMLFHASKLELGFPILDLARKAGFGGVDLFILLSSMGLALSLIRREQDYTAFMLRRAGRILPSYYAVMLPYTLFLILAQGVPWSTLFWNSTLLYYWVRCPGAFNWYVCGAMLFYALTPPVLRWLRRQHARGRLLPAAGALILAGLALCQLLLREGYFYTTDIFYRIPVFVLGLVLGIFIAEERPLGWRDVLGWAAWTALGGIYLLAAFSFQGEDQPVILPMAHLFVFSTVPTALVLALAFQRLPLGWLCRFLRLLGENSLEIYLLNVSFFSQTGLLNWFVSAGLGSQLYYLLALPLNAALGILLHRGMKRLRARAAAG